MAKDLEASVVTQIDAATSQPVLLFEFTLNAGTLRFCAANSNIVFPTAGNTYTGKAIELDSVSSSTEGQINRVSFRFDNVEGDWTTYTNAESFDGKALIIKKIYRDALGDSSYYVELFNGYLEEVRKLTRYWCEMSAVSGKPLGRQMLLDIFQERCNHLFGYGQCQQDGNADLTSLTATGTADSGTTSTLVDDALTEADDYWNFGRVAITISGKVYYRRVKDFDAAGDEITFDVPLHSAVSNGDAYTVYKGCDQTWTTCGGSNSWGPSADNSANFGGFIHINRISSNSTGVSLPSETTSAVSENSNDTDAPSVEEVAAASAYDPAQLASEDPATAAEEAVGRQGAETAADILHEEFVGGGTTVGEQGAATAAEILQEEYTNPPAPTPEPTNPYAGYPLSTLAGWIEESAYFNTDIDPQLQAAYDAARAASGGNAGGNYDDSVGRQGAATAAEILQEEWSGWW